MPDELAARLVVMDTGPLITLAAAESLAYLLYPGVPVYLPDAVLYEATRDAAALGTQAILDWAQHNSKHVTTVSTETFFNFVRSRATQPAWRERDLGERAAIEVVHDGLQLATHERAVLMTEDDRVLRRILVTGAELTSRMIPITTRDLLESLEAAGRINSADDVYSRAEDAGRLASRRAVLREQHDHARQAVERMVGRDAT